jgi:hypothetical protein
LLSTSGSAGQRLRTNRKVSGRCTSPGSTHHLGCGRVPGDDVTTSCGNHRPPSREPTPESETLSYDGADCCPQRRDRGTERVRQHGENDQRGGKGRVSTRTSGDAVDCLLERGRRDHRVAREIGTRSGFAHLRAWRGENAADTTTTEPTTTSVSRVEPSPETPSSPQRGRGDRTVPTGSPREAARD